MLSSMLLRSTMGAAASKKCSASLPVIFPMEGSIPVSYTHLDVYKRQGINISPQDLAWLDELISPLILRGQSPYMILQSHPEIPYSEKTIYNYIESGALSVKNIDLPKKVKYKIRSKGRSEVSDKTVFEGRTYKDFQGFLKEFPDRCV